MSNSKTNKSMTRSMNESLYDRRIYEECITKDLYEDNFLDSSHMNEVLDQKWLMDTLIKEVASVDYAICFYESIPGLTTPHTPYGIINTDEEKIVVQLGCTQVTPPLYEIEPDFEPGLVVFDWYQKYCQNPDIEFPYVPVAQPVIPHVAKERAASSDDVDKVMIKVGGLVFDPSFPLIETADPSEYLRLDYDHKILMDNEMEAKMYHKKFIFSSRSNYIWHWNRQFRCAAFEFNPFHPMAFPYIITYDDDGLVIRGTYRWGRNVRDFYFNRKSVKYRIHYEKWGSLFAYRNHYLAIFDLVANFDIWELGIFLVPPNLYNLTPKYVVEGYYVDPCNTEYSRISDPRREELMGPDTIMSYYSHIPIKIKNVGRHYINVTADYELRYYNMSKWELFVNERKTGKTVVTLFYTDKKNFHRQEGTRLFVQYSMRSSRLRVYVREDQATEDERSRHAKKKKKIFVFNPGCFFFWFASKYGGIFVAKSSG